MIDKKVLQMHFSRSAANYDTYARVQKKMAHELIRIDTLDFIKNHADLDILDIGCGTGYLTNRLLSCYPGARITAVDIAPGMIEFAREKFKYDNVEFMCLDIEEAELEKKYDLIISNATFQWFNNLEGTIEKLGQRLKNNGVLAFSTFGNRTFHELYCSSEIARKKLNIHGQSSPSQRFFKMEEILEICREKLQGVQSCPYEMMNSESLEYEHFNTVREFLDAVKKIGANNSNHNRRPNTALTKEMIRTYEDTYKIDGLVRATYHCIFIAARKVHTPVEERKRVNAIG